MGFGLLIFKVTFFYNLFEFCSLNMIIPPWYFTPFTPRCLHKSMFSSFCSILSNSFQQTEVHEHFGGCFSNKCPELKLQGVVCVQPPASNSGKFASILGVRHTQGILGGSSQDL